MLDKFSQLLAFRTTLKYLDLPFRGEMTFIPPQGRMHLIGSSLIDADGLDYLGFGAATSPRIAAAKSIMECLEQVAHRDARVAQLSRSGLAGHFEYAEAKQRAYAELVERDALLYHWFCKVPGTPVSPQRVFEELGLTPLMSQYRKVRAIHLEPLDPALQVAWISCQHDNDTCWLMGLGCAATPEAALKKAATEWLGGWFRHQFARLCPDRKNAKTPYHENFSFHHRLTLENPDVRDRLEYLFSARKSRLTTRRQVPALESKTQYRALPTRSKKYFIVQATHPDLVAIVFGKEFDASKEKIREQLFARCDYPEVLPLRGEPLLYHPLD